MPRMTGKKEKTNEKKKKRESSIRHRGRKRRRGRRKSIKKGRKSLDERERRETSRKESVPLPFYEEDREELDFAGRKKMN